MKSLISLVIIFIMILVSIAVNLPIVFPLIAGLFLFYFYGIKKGFKLREMLFMTFKGIVKSRLILEIFILIGAITSLWLFSGSIPYLVYHSLNLIHPYLFIFMAFLVSSFISILLGTSFGVVSTIGIVIITVARTSSININLVAGAIIAGAYFGDRISPMSSSANLVASITGTNLYRNIKNMAKSTFIPLLIVMAMYLAISFFNPLEIYENPVESHIMQTFKLNWLCLLPVIILFTLIIFKVRIKLAMFISALCAFFVSVFFQDFSFIEVLKGTFTGFHLEAENPLNKIISGGGIFSMLYPGLVVAISSAYAGILEKTGMLEDLEKFIAKTIKKYGNFTGITLLSIITCAVGCTQTMGIILGEQLSENIYRKTGKTKEELALDIEDSAVLIAPLIPWNMAGMVPAMTLSVGIGYIPFAFYCYIPTIYILIKRYLNHKQFLLKHSNCGN